MRRVQAAGIAQVNPLANELTKKLMPVFKKYFIEPAKEIFESYRPGKSVASMLRSEIDSFTKGFEKETGHHPFVGVPINDLSDFKLPRLKEQALFTKAKLCFGPSGGLGEFSSRKDSPEVSIAINIIYLAEMSLSDFSQEIDEVVFERRFKSVLAHELQHLADWAYLTSSQQDYARINDHDIHDYHLRDTEQKSWALDTANALWEKFVFQGERFLVRELPHISSQQLLREIQATQPGNTMWPKLSGPQRQIFVRRVWSQLRKELQQHRDAKPKYDIPDPKYRPKKYKEPAV